MILPHHGLSNLHRWLEVRCQGIAGVTPIPQRRGFLGGAHLSNTNAGKQAQVALWNRLEGEIIQEMLVSVLRRENEAARDHRARVLGRVGPAFANK